MVYLGVGSFLFTSFRVRRGFLNPWLGVLPSFRCLGSVPHGQWGATKASEQGTDAVTFVDSNKGENDSYNFSRTRQYPEHFISSSSQQRCDLEIILPILQMRKSRLLVTSTGSSPAAQSVLSDSGFVGLQLPWRSKQPHVTVYTEINQN